MKFESLLPIGQSLRQIEQKHVPIYSKCPHCKKSVFYKWHWELVDIEQKIVGVVYQNDKIYYRIYHPGIMLYIEIPENQINVLYYTCRAAASTAAVRLNNF